MGPSRPRICNENKRLEAAFAITYTLTNSLFSAIYALLTGLQFAQPVSHCSNLCRV